MKETKGQKMARELRAKCNNMTQEERHDSYNNAIDFIYKHKKPHEFYHEITLLKEEIKQKDKEIERLENRVNDLEDKYVDKQAR